MAFFSSPLASLSSYLSSMALCVWLVRLALARVLLVLPAVFLSSAISSFHQTNALLGLGPPLRGMETSHASQYIDRMCSTLLSRLSSTDVSGQVLINMAASKRSQSSFLTTQPREGLLLIRSRTTPGWGNSNFIYLWSEYVN